MGNGNHHHPSTFASGLNLPGFGRHAAATDADRNVTTTVERVDSVGEGGCQFVVFRDRHGEQLALAAAFQRMNHS